MLFRGYRRLSGWMRHRRLAGLPIGKLLLCLAAGGAAAGSTGPSTAPPVSGYTVVAVFPHDASAFTQGLVYADGRLFESKGLFGQSALREIELETGRVLREAPLERRFFGEGVTLWQDSLVQLTWRSRVGLIYDAGTLELRGRFSYEGEGWGITQDGRHWILSDGSARLRFMDPGTRRVVKVLEVRDRGRPVRQLNELEYIDGEIWANLWGKDRIARIDPETGAVRGYVDLADLWPRRERPAGTDVLNGIAYDAASDRLFVTGKLWPKLYEIRIVD